MYTSLLLTIQVLSASQTKLSVHWEELTAADFRDGIARAQGTCLLPFGIMEKHGPHLPLGNDLLNVRYVALNAAQQEYAIVFPEYYFGQIFEAKHEPGTVAYSRGRSSRPPMITSCTCWESCAPGQGSRNTNRTRRRTCMPARAKRP